MSRCLNEWINVNKWFKMWVKRANPQITKWKPNVQKNRRNSKRWNGKRLFWIIVNAKFWD